MLIGFSVGNFLSFKDIQPFSFIASSIKEHKETNTFDIDKDVSLLKSSVIYGANSSGKTNLFLAIRFMKDFVFGSSKDKQIHEKIDVDRFKLSTEMDNKPSYLEIVFVHKKVKYRYGFEVDSVRIHREWLYYSANGKKRESNLFLRENDKFDLSSEFAEGKLFIKEKKIRNNALLVSISAQFNGEISKKILEWFDTFHIISGLKDHTYIDYTMNKFEDGTYKKEILNFVKIADIGIDDLVVETQKLTYDMLPKEMLEETKKKILSEMKEIKSFYTKHKKYDNKKNIVDKVLFDIEKESNGTQKFLALAGPIIDTLKKGSILAIDELDSSLHPVLTRSIFKLFHSKKTNPNNSQLIFASHDTNLLDKQYFRRDQIWFMEKDDYEATDLYSLTELKPKVRNDASYEKDYILGKYGAIPFIGDINTLFIGSDRNE